MQPSSCQSRVIDRGLRPVSSSLINLICPLCFNGQDYRLLIS